MKINLPVRGFRYQDSDTNEKLEFIRKKFLHIGELFHLKFINFPIVEEAKLFTNCGEDSDIVNKELFYLENKEYCLIPEGTSSFVKYVNSNQGNYGMFIDCFRYNKPQKGRYRQFHQMGVEMIGNGHYTQDVNLILIAETLLKELNINKYELEINSIGSKEDRIKYNAILREYFAKNFEYLSEESKDRYNRGSFLRILDSKNDDQVLKNVPIILDYLSEESKKKYDNIKSLLQSLNIKFKENYQLVRGLDYYNDLVFEYTSNLLGAQCSFGGGGRYDGLFERVTGESVSAVGFGLGVERIEIMLEALNFQVPKNKNILLLPIEENDLMYAYKVQQILHTNNISSEILYNGHNLSKRMQKNSDKYDYIILIGETESKNNTCIIKDLNNRTETTVKLENISNKLFE